jgi:hypothetical protein
MPENLPTQRSNQLDKFLKQMKSATRGRLIFALDATGNRRGTWDQACQLTGEMFAETANIGELEVQLVYYRGLDECRHSSWTSNSRELADKMSRITCKGGNTQIIRILKHIANEHAQKPVSAAVFVGDAMEGDKPGALIDAAAGLGVPLFMFQEGDDPEVEKVFRELARLTGGAYAKFTSGAARELGDMLRAVAAFAAGGRRALESQNTDSARKLLGQLKKKDE